MITTGEILITALLFIGGTAVTIIGYFLTSTMDKLNKTETLAQKTKNELDVLSKDHENKHEFITEKFEDLKYDFDNGVLTLDEPKNDLVLTTEVHKQGSATKIVGQVFVRSSAVSGSLELVQESDEPGDDDESGDQGGNGNHGEHRDREGNGSGHHKKNLKLRPVPFVPLLDGQYEGNCDGKAADGWSGDIR